MPAQSVIDRNKRLDALEKAVKFWADKRREEINRRVEQGKRILEGRTGSERLARANVQAASALVVDAIDDFLVTG